MLFEDGLSEFLRDCSGLVVAGIGNTLRKDDAVGIMIIKRLKGKVPPEVKLIDCGAVPENFSLEFKKSAPSHIIFFDAVDMGMEPGSYAIVNEGSLKAQSMSTHKQSVRVLFMVLRDGLPGVRIALVGIQPKSVEFGTGLSSPVARALGKVVEETAGAIGRIVAK